MGDMDKPMRPLPPDLMNPDPRKYLHPHISKFLIKDYEFDRNFNYCYKILSVLLLNVNGKLKFDFIICTSNRNHNHCRNFGLPSCSLLH